MVWRGIEIHPEYSPEGRKRRKTFRYYQATETLKEIAKEDNTSIELPGFVTNSRLSLEAAEFAKTKDLFLEFHKLTYKYFFFRKENIGKKEIILKIGNEAGLDIDELELNLNERKFSNKISENMEHAKKDNAFGVPTFMFNEFKVHGVQSPETFRNILETNKVPYKN